MFLSIYVKAIIELRCHLKLRVQFVHRELKCGGGSYQLLMDRFFHLYVACLRGKPDLQSNGLKYLFQAFERLYAPIIHIHSGASWSARLISQVRCYLSTVEKW